MTAAAKQKVSIPTLEERVVALMEELEEALDQLASARRPVVKDVLNARGEIEIVRLPRGDVRAMINAKGGGCLCKSYLAAVKE